MSKKIHICTRASLRIFATCTLILCAPHAARSEGSLQPYVYPMAVQSGGVCTHAHAVVYERGLSTRTTICITPFLSRWPPRVQNMERPLGARKTLLIEANSHAVKEEEATLFIQGLHFTRPLY